VVVVGNVFSAISRRAGVSSDYRAGTVARATLTIRSVADQSTPPDRGDLDEPDLYLDFADRIARFLCVDLALEGFKLYYVVTPSV